MVKKHTSRRHTFDMLVVSHVNRVKRTNKRSLFFRIYVANSLFDDVVWETFSQHFSSVLKRRICRRFHCDY